MRPACLPAGVFRSVFRESTDPRMEPEATGSVHHVADHVLSRMSGLIEQDARQKGGQMPGHNAATSTDTGGLKGTSPKSMLPPLQV